MGFLIKFLLAGFLLAGTATAQHATGPVEAPADPLNPKLEAEQVFLVSQDAIGGQTGNHILRDHRGAELALADFRGKPLVVSLIFTSCGSVCPVTTDHLRDAVIAARKTLGKGRFNVLTFGFDSTGDTPAQLTGFANTHNLAGVEDWYLASADAATIEAFLTELGFSWRPSAGGFDHVTQTSILDSEGRVYRQVYGEEFPLPVFMQPMKDLILGKVTQSIAPEDLWNRLTFLCTVYNPLTRAYRFDYGILFGIFFGALSLIMTGLIIYRLWLERRRSLRPRATAIRAGTGTGTK